MTAPQHARVSPLHSRLRADLEIRLRVRGGRREVWIADPISGRVVRTDERELRQLSGTAEHGTSRSDGQVSAASGWLAAARHNLLRRRPPVVTRDSQLRGTQPQCRERLGRQPRWWHNPLYVRLPGIAADGLARWLADRSGWLFARSSVVLWCVGLVITALALLPHGHRMWGDLTRLPAFQAEHWVYALGVLLVTKVLHELAHAAVCRRQGAPCRELGVLLLCGTPCLYCDVSESWRIASPRRRMSVMAAGIYVEWIVAAAALWIWLLGESPAPRLAALHVAFVSGVSTFLFNANPLMRYDGYFLLSDAVNLPHLKQRAAGAFHHWVMASWAHFPRWRAKAIGLPSGTLLLAAYHAMAGVYRWVILAALGGWAYLVLERWGLEPLGRLLLWLLFAALAVGVAGRLGRMIRGQGFWQHVSPGRRLPVAVGLAALVAGLLFVPVRSRVRVGGEVGWHNAQPVFVPYRATVREALVALGDSVAQGQPLLRLEDVELSLDRIRAVTRRDQLQLRLAALRAGALAEPRLLDAEQTLVAAAAAARADAQRIDERLAEGVLRAPQNGTVLPVHPPVTQRESIAGNALPGHLPPVGATLPAGAMCCLIGTPSSKCAWFDVSADQRRAFHTGQSLRLYLGQSGRVITSEIVAVELWVEADRGAANRRASAEAQQSGGRFRVACALPPALAEETLVGTTVTAVAKGTPVTGWDLLTDWLRGPR